MNKPQPFCLRSLLDTVRSKSGEVALLICGGRGVGKSTLLDEIWHEVREIGGSDSVVLRGRNSERVRRRLGECSSLPQAPRIVLIDDLDIILAGRSEEHTPASVEEMLLLLLPENNQIRDAGYRFIATSAPHWLWRSNTTLSSLLPQLHRIDLDPWSYGWEITWYHDFEKLFRGRISESELRLWSEEILLLTGGHPALYGPALDRLGELCEQIALVEKQHPTTNKRHTEVPTDLDRHCSLIRHEPHRTESRDELRARMRQYLEDYLLRDSTVRIGAAITELQNSESALHQEAFRWLVNVARQETTEVDPPEKADIRIILEDIALVYRQKSTGKYCIPGLITRNLVRRIAAEQSEITIIDSRDRGEIRFGSLAPISITGSQWRLFRTLYNNLGEIVSSEHLVESAGLKGKRPLPYAIRRLQTILTNHGFRGKLVNEYGHGYRLLPRRSSASSKWARGARSRHSAVLVGESSSEFSSEELYQRELKKDDPSGFAESNPKTISNPSTASRR